MQKIKYNIEYPLKNASLAVLWNSIGTPLGLSEWFADGVTVSENEYVFTWDQHEQTAILLQKKQNSFIRFCWEEDEGSEYYFEISINLIEITGDLTIVVTDFVEPSEVADAELLWNQQIDVLKRKSGI